MLSDETVKTHVGHVFPKLGLRDGAQAAAAAVAAYRPALVVPRA